jgi:7-carboxy-7-deazaguanine synthase
VGKYGLPLVTVTGGEPLLQKNCYLLLDNLIADKYKVILETNGSFDTHAVNPAVHRIIDMKCPGSEMARYNDYNNFDELIAGRDEVKFVLTDYEDYRWARETTLKYSLSRRCTVLFSPAWNTLEPLHAAEWILADGLEVKLQIPLHRILWPGRTRGI